MLFDQVLLIYWFTTRGGENQISEWRVRDSRTMRAVSQLPEQTENPGLQFYNSTTSSPLRVRKVPLPIVPVNRPNDTDGSAIPVDVPPGKGKVLARTHPGCKSNSKEALLGRMCRSPQK